MIRNLVNADIRDQNLIRINVLLQNQVQHANTQLFGGDAERNRLMQSLRDCEAERDRLKL